MKRTVIATAVVILLVSCSPAANSSPQPTPIQNTALPTAVAPAEITPAPELIVVQPDGLDWLSNGPVKNVEKIYGVAISQDRAKLAVYTSVGVYLYDSRSFRQAGKIDLTFTSLEDGLPIAFSPDGFHLAFAQDNNIVLWNLATNSKEGTFQSVMGDRPPFYLEFNPSGDRIILAAYSSSYFMDALAVNFALYDLQGNVMFDKFLVADHAEYYFRQTKDEKLYLFFASMLSGIMPISLDIVDTRTGAILEAVTYDFETSSYSSDIVFYDVSTDGQVAAVDITEADKHKTMLVNPVTREAIKIIDQGFIKFLPPDDNGIVQWEPEFGYRITGVFDVPSDILTRCNFGERPAINGVPQFDGKLILLLPHFRSIKAIEIWDVSSCTLEKGIVFSTPGK